jgi:hypothetical protein
MSTRPLLVYERPRLYCGTCGARMQEKQLDPMRREIHCAEPGCERAGEHVTIADAGRYLIPRQ